MPPVLQDVSRTAAPTAWESMSRHSLESSEREEFPATQCYGAMDAMDGDFLDSDAPGALESFNATQAYDFESHESDNILATQVYLDDIDAGADTLQYSDMSVLQNETGVDDSDPPEILNEAELMATQAYAEDDLVQAEDAEDESNEKEAVQSMRAKASEAIPFAGPREPCDMPPPMVPDRKRKRDEPSEANCEAKLSWPDQNLRTAVATPVRSPRPASHEVLHVEDSPPKPEKTGPKRRRLYGKQPPPFPNPFLPPPRLPGRVGLLGLPEVEVKGRQVKAAKASRARKATSRKRQKVYFAVTGFVLDRVKRDKLEKIPGVVVLDEWSSKVTHVIAKGFRRTTKLMCAVCAGLHIVVPEFIDECIKAGDVIDEEAFLLRDEISEATFAEKHQLPIYSLQTAVQQARIEGALLRNKSVYWIDGSAAEREELRLLVEAAGGRWLKRKPRKPPAAEAVVATAPKSLWLGKDFDPELLREAACTQVLRWETYRL